MYTNAHSQKGVFLKLPSRQSLLLIFSIFVISGAFFQQLVLGPEFSRVRNPLALALGIALYVPIYFYYSANALLKYGAFVRNINRLPEVVAYLFLAFLTTLWSIEPSTSLREAVTMTATLVCAFAIPITLSEEKFFRIAGTAFLLICGVSLIFIWLIPSYGVMRGDTIDLQNSSLTGLPQGVFRHKNQLAAVASIGAIIAISARGYLPSKTRIILFISAMTCVLVSYSVAKTASLLAAIFLLVIWEIALKLIRSRQMIGLLLLFAAFGSVLVIPFLIETGLYTIGKNSTFSGRTYIWGHAIEFIKQNPVLGYGLNSIWNETTGYIPELPYFQPDHSHNTFLEVWLQTGLFGVILLLLFLFRIFFTLVGKYELGAPSDRFAFLMFVSILIRMIFEFSLFSPNNVGHFMLTVAFLYFVMSKSNLEKNTIMNTKNSEI